MSVLGENELPVFWGNKVWVERNGVVAPLRNLDPSDQRWVNYDQLSMAGSELLATNGYPNADLRRKLHEQIISKVLGINPRSEEDRSLPHCVLTHGGVASGKTSAMDIYHETNAAGGVNFLRIDFDLIKQELPEYQFMREKGIAEAAMFTQSESAKIAGRTVKRAITGLYHIIYEGSLQSLDTIKDRIREMRKKNYFITVVSTFVPPDVGLRRAHVRYHEKGGRFISPEAVLQSYLGCQRTLNELSILADETYLIDNTGHEKAALMAISEAGDLKIADRKLYERYKSLVPKEGWLD